MERLQGGLASEVEAPLLVRLNPFFRILLINSGFFSGSFLKEEQLPIISLSFLIHL